MTDRERYLETIRFGHPDRFPYRFGGPRQSTLEAWYYQGLKRDVNLGEVMGSDKTVGTPIDTLPLPRFEEVTLKEFDDKRIWIDQLGGTRIDQKHPVTPGFVTRSWLEFPVKNRKDFEEMKKRYQPDTPGRVPDNWDEFVKILNETGGFIMAHWDGTAETEEKIKNETKATIRCIPFDSPDEDGKCIYSGKPSKRRVLFALSY